MPGELDISIDEIVSVASAAVRGESLKHHAAAIRQYTDEALVKYHTLAQALKTANEAHERAGSNAVRPEDRLCVDAATAYVDAENRLLHELMELAAECGGGIGGIEL